MSIYIQIDMGISIIFKLFKKTSYSHFIIMNSISQNFHSELNLTVLECIAFSNL